MKNPLRPPGKKLIAIIIPLLLLAACPTLAATRPDTGTVLESARPPAVQAPGEKTAPPVTVEDREPTAGTGGNQTIPLTGFRIGGEPPLPADELLKFVQDQADRDITLDRLNALADKITQYLRQKGYPVAFAYIPPQDIKDGVVEIAVVPGKYGQIRINGSARVSHDLLTGMLHDVRPGGVIASGPLERALLLLRDLHGLTIKAVLAPGETPGTADLILETADTAKLRGVFFADNWGNRYTSRSRLGVQLEAGNISGLGDDLSLGGLVTAGGRMNNYNLGYSVPLGYGGVRLNARHSRVEYTLGDTFAAIGATGRATVSSADLSYPLVRSRAFNLNITLGYEEKRLRDDVAATDTFTPKNDHLLSLVLAGNFADNCMGGGKNTFTVTRYQGRLTIKDAAAAATDAATANTAGDFIKTVVVLQRRQHLADNLDLHLNFTGQLADKNLDSAEKLFLGGPDAVRAFPQGEAAGDQGYRLTGELRWRLPGLSAGRDNLYLAGFYDYGSVIVDRRPWPGASASNRRSLMGAGLGLLWTRSPDFSLRLDYAWKLGDEQALADRDKRGRLWLQGVRFF